MDEMIPTEQTERVTEALRKAWMWAARADEQLAGGFEEGAIARAAVAQAWAAVASAAKRT